MEIIKEYRDCIVVLRTKTYAKTLGYFVELFNEAKKDFPQLDPDNVQVVKYGGRYYKGTMGIEFEIVGDKPVDYREIVELETVL
jgi:hypothetical protein